MKTKGILKEAKNIRCFKPKNIRLSFYISVLKDVSLSLFSNLSEDDVKDVNYINPKLFDVVSFEVESKIFNLLDEGLIAGVKTGADTGIYDGYIDAEPNTSIYKYKDVSHLVQTINNSPVNEQLYPIYDNNFDNCVLAEANPLGEQSSQVVKTFKGYLEVELGEYSFIRKCSLDKSNITTVRIPNTEVKKYQLRQGDEILCTCVQYNNDILMGTLLTINQQSIYQYNKFRPWIQSLQTKKTDTKLNGVGDYTKAIINKIDVLEGDNIFVYLTNTSSKNQVIPRLVKELNSMFDEVIYINPNYNGDIVEGVVKFCAPVNALPNYQATIALLGTHHARRLMELDVKVAVIIDDIDAIICLENKLPQYKYAISKTLLNTYKMYQNSYTNFTLVPLRSYSIDSYHIPHTIKTFENVGIVIDNNEVDLFNSYRV